MLLIDDNVTPKFNLANEDTRRKTKKSKKCDDKKNKISFPELKVSHAKSFLEYFGKEGKNISADKLYEIAISKEMMDKYGPYFSDSFDKKNVEIPPENFIARHQFNPILRRKLVDWMIEIFYKLDSDENTFFAAVRIMDKFIWKCPSIITEKSIYKVGVTCIYIASKTYDYYPIKMKELIHKISHDSLQEQIVKKLEGMILTAINFDIMSPGPSEFIQFLLYDLYMNNKGIISRYRLRNIIDIVENCAIWTAKMCYHFEKYSSKSPNHIAVACLFIGYEMAKDNKHLNSNEKQFFVEWLEYLLQKIGINEEGKNYINNLYKDIYQTFIKFKKMSYKNLVKFHYLFFE
jgi:hypothetical protein